LSRPVSFDVHGHPQTQGSKKSFAWTDKVTGKARSSMVESAGDKLKSWRTMVSDKAREAMDGAPMMEGPVMVWAVFSFIRPKSHYGTGRNAGKLKASTAIPFPVTKGDLDKLMRAIGDGMTKIVYRDDKQICQLNIGKRWAQSEGVMIKVTSMEDE